MQNLDKKYNLEGSCNNMTRDEWEAEIVKILHERFGAPPDLLINPDIMDLWEIGSTVREGVHAYKTFAIIHFGGLR